MGKEGQLTINSLQSSATKNAKSCSELQTNVILTSFIAEPHRRLHYLMSPGISFVHIFCCWTSVRWGSCLNAQCSSEDLVVIFALHHDPVTLEWRPFSSWNFTEAICAYPADRSVACCRSWQPLPRGSPEAAGHGAPLARGSCHCKQHSRSLIMTFPPVSMHWSRGHCL